MGRRLYVGNLTYNTTDDGLRQLFEQHGSVTSAQVIMDRDTGRSKGFGFVEMGSDQEAQAAIAALNGKEVDGRTLTVNEARPKTEGGGGRGGSGGGGGRGGYGGGGGGGRGGHRRWRLGGGRGGGGPALLSVERQRPPPDSPFFPGRRHHGQRRAAPSLTVMAAARNEGAARAGAFRFPHGPGPNCQRNG